MRINTFQNCYGLAIKRNKGNPQAMSVATMVILSHYKESPSHEDCPQGKDSWCSFNRDKATGENTYRPIKDPLPNAVVEVIKPLFERLGSPSFLSAVANCCTQNVNESFHHLVWQLAPKETYTSTNETKCALFLAVSLFNDGYASSLENICELARIKVYENMKNQWNKFDSVKLYHKNSQKGEKTKTSLKKRKRKNLKNQEAFIRQEGVTYKSGNFHIGSNNIKDCKL